jgi:hypothetical protein
MEPMTDPKMKAMIISGKNSLSSHCFVGTPKILRKYQKFENLSEKLNKDIKITLRISDIGSKTYN